MRTRHDDSYSPLAAGGGAGWKLYHEPAAPASTRVDTRFLGNYTRAPDPDQVHMEGKISRNPAVDFTSMKNECVLFHAETNQFCLLNASATFLWNLLERPRTVSELADALCQHFEGVSTPQAIRDVEQTVDQLKTLCLASSQS